MFTGVKVFSATKAREREELGENVTRWLRSNADLEVVDRVGFSPDRDDSDLVLREQLKLAQGPVFLAVGGVEARKNTLAILAAFTQIQKQRPMAQLIIAGGATVLDHASYQQQFAAALARAGQYRGKVIFRPNAH